SLDRWTSLHYIPAESHAWGGAGETLEDVTADFSLAQLARRLGDDTLHDAFLERSGYWRNVFNSDATPEGGYIQNRSADGSWPDFQPPSSRGFAEGSSAQYTWMVPFDSRGLFDAMGGEAEAVRRLDDFFHADDGGWALTGLGGMHAEMDNEPSIGAPWLYLFAGKAYRTQEAIRETRKRLWSPTPYGIPGNDDLGAMSAWYVWAAMGMYPGIPGRAELLLASPLFPAVEVRRPDGTTITMRAAGADDGASYVHGLRVNGESTTRSWLPESFVGEGGELVYELSTARDTAWGAGPDDVPPSFGPEGRRGSRGVDSVSRSGPS
ncbi:MAG TPA: glycoside hydrolase domain-containing protein, partial [Longimicrobiales bacterium]|nr:glycoside hydrolase domain-containing protein [Longimicrobiales bacterium]